MHHDGKPRGSEASESFVSRRPSAGKEHHPYLLVPAPLGMKVDVTDIPATLELLDADSYDAGDHPDSLGRQ